MMTTATIPTLTVKQHASNYSSRFSATPFTFPGGRYGVGTRSQRLINKTIEEAYIDDADRAYADECNQADTFRGF